MEQTAITNRKARFNYEIIDTKEAGIELFGHEVKSLKASHADITGAHVTIRGGEAWLLNMNVRPYQENNVPKDYDPLRPRRLLLTKEEITELETQVRTANLTIVPIRVYNKGRFVKIEIGLGRGKKKADKREAVKKRDAKREIQRAL
ncbi:MAG: SsrA-binding protein SmpB [Candidatus Pacebacteria bacterium]|nr:SsrA-binding protein SmpB [Candidatus Paceibacterota bacterium]